MEVPIIARGSILRALGYLFPSVSLLYNIFRIEDMENFVAVTCLSAGLLIFPHFILRLFLLLEETFLCNHRYSISQLVERSLRLNNKSAIICLLELACVLHRYETLRPLECVQKVGITVFCLSIFAFFILFWVVELHQCPAWEAYIMRNMKGLDYGSGMAHSYFHGYLRLILPTRGDNVSGFRRRIESFMEAEKIDDHEFPVKKLIILVPSSGFIFPKLSDDSSFSGPECDIEPAKALQDHVRDRAGTQQRVYRGGAYRITVRSGDEKSFLYAVAEGATPMLTFREAYSGSSQEAGHLREHKVDVVSNFHRTLLRIIEEDPECRNLVDLLYYNDEDPQNPPDVVQILRTHLLRQRDPLQYRFCYLRPLSLLLIICICLIAAGVLTLMRWS